MDKDEIIIDILEKTYGKVEIQGTAIQEIRVEQVRQSGLHDKNTTDLSHHIARTDLLEASLATTKTEVQEMKSKFEGANMLLKFFGYFGSAILVIEAAIKIYTSLSHLRI